MKRPEDDSWKRYGPEGVRRELIPYEPPRWWLNLLEASVQASDRFPPRYGHEALGAIRRVLERFSPEAVVVAGTSRPATLGFLRLLYGVRWREVLRG